MKRDVNAQPTPCYLGIEAGGTRTVTMLDTGNGLTSFRLESGPANLRLISDGDLTRHF